MNKKENIIDLGRTYMRQLPKTILRLSDNMELHYRRCTGIYKNPKTKDYVTADYYVGNKELFKIILE